MSQWTYTIAPLFNINDKTLGEIKEQRFKMLLNRTVLST
jgi:hypothetical protein